MNFEELQHIWKTSDIDTPPAAVDQQLIDQIRRDSRQFAHTVFWRDVREILASLFVAGIFAKIALAATAEGSPAWPAWMAAFLPIFVGAFLLINRWWVRRWWSPQGGSVLAELERASEVLENQIWLLRTVFWWYLLPLALSVGLICLQWALYVPMEIPFALRLLACGVVMIPVALFNWWIWKLNQKAIRVDLLPQLEQLRDLRAQLAMKE